MGFSLSTIGVDTCVDASTVLSTLIVDTSLGLSMGFSASFTSLSTVSTGCGSAAHHSSTSSGFASPLSRSPWRHQDGSAPSTSMSPPFSPSRKSPSDVIKNVLCFCTVWWLRPALLAIYLIDRPLPYSREPLVAFCSLWILSQLFFCVSLSLITYRVATFSKR